MWHLKAPPIIYLHFRKNNGLVVNYRLKKGDYLNGASLRGTVLRILESVRICIFCFMAVSAILFFLVPMVFTFMYMCV